MEKDLLEKYKKEKSDCLVKVIFSILNELPKPCSEKDLKKQYHRQFKQNISKALDEIGNRVGEFNLYSFLRKRCFEICEVITNDGVVRIHRFNGSISTEVNEEVHNDKKKAKKKTNKNPKLKYKVIESSNSQQLKSIKNNTLANKSISSVIFPNVYRSKDQLVKFLSLKDDYDSGGDELQKDNDHEDVFNLMEILKMSRSPPKIENPFDFPCLPVVKKEFESNDITVAYSEMPYCSSTPIKINIDSPTEFDIPKHSQILSNIEMTLISNQLLFNLYPEILNDQNTFDQKELLKINETHQIRLSLIYSSNQFYFQCMNKQYSCFMNKMKQFYDSSKDLMTLSCGDLKIGLFVAVAVGPWYLRAKIQAYLNIQNQLKVIFIDLGIEKLVNLSLAFSLIQEFIRFPINLHRGSFIIPSKINRSFPSNPTEFFKLIADKVFTIIIKNYDKESNAYELEFN